MGALVALSAISTGASILSSQTAASKQSELLRMQQTQQRLAATQQSLKRTKQLQETMSTANAMGAARGLSLSPNIASINEQSAQNYFSDERMQDLNNKMSDAYTDAEIGSIHARANASSFQSLINFGSNTIDNMPMYGNDNLYSTGNAKPWVDPDKQKRR